MKSKARKQEDLKVLTEQFEKANVAMFLSFNKLTVDKDQQFRNELRENGATYKVVKNTLGRLAVKGTKFEDATEHFNGVTSVAWTEDEPVDISKTISKYLKEFKDNFEFKTGIINGRIVDLDEVKTIATLPSKEELIAKILYLLNSPAQRLATVLNAVPRDLAVVVKQVSERPEGETAAKVEEKAEDNKKETPAAEEAKEDDKASEEKVEGETKDSGSDEKAEEKNDDSAADPKEEKAETDSKDDAEENSADESAEGKE